MKRLGFLALLALATPAFGQVTNRQGAAYVDVESLKNSYSVGFDFSGYTTPTDVWCINGSATRTVRIRHIQMNGQATSATQADIILLKRSTADTGGTPTAITPTPYDIQDPAGTATVNVYTAAPTTGTLVGSELFDQQINLTAPGGGNPPYLVNWSFGTDGTKTIVLRGAGDGVCWNWGGAAWPAGGKVSVTIEWTEDP